MTDTQKNELRKYISESYCGRNIKWLVVHCTATREGNRCNVADIDRMHKARGFSRKPYSGHYCGYHFVIAQDGSIEKGRVLREMGAHVSGYNSYSIGIVYVGGLDKLTGKPKDTGTDAQKESLVWLLGELRKRFPKAVIRGHRDFSPDLDGNGRIDPWEYIKACPCFDASKEYRNL